MSGWWRLNITNDTHAIEYSGIEYNRDSASIKRLTTKGPGVRAIGEVKDTGENACPRLVVVQNLI